MKAFIEHDESGLLSEQAVRNPNETLAFPTTREDSDPAREGRLIKLAEAASYFEPSLIARLSSRVPGAYQSGE